MEDIKLGILRIRCPVLNENSRENGLEVFVRFEGVTPTGVMCPNYIGDGKCSLRATKPDKENSYLHCTYSNWGLFNKF